MSEFFEAGVCAVPSNFGPLKDWDGRARITGPCGDTMEFWVSIADNRIEVAHADEELVGSDGFIDWSRFELL